MTPPSVGASVADDLNELMTKALQQVEAVGRALDIYDTAVAEVEAAVARGTRRGDAYYNRMPKAAKAMADTLREAVR